MVNDRDDIIADFLRRVLQAAKSQGGITENTAQAIAKKVRDDWAGSRPYIAHNKDEKIAQRNEKIYTAYWDENQRDIPRLAARFGISQRQVRRIIFD
jgi:Mor family transcriptional regulator